MSAQKYCPCCERVLAPLRKRNPGGARHVYCVSCKKVWFLVGTQIYLCRCPLNEEALTVGASP